MRIEKRILPAFLASALINGDTSGLEESDAKWLEAVYEHLKGGHIVDCSEETHFSNYCSLPTWRLGADMAEYTVMYDE